MNNKRILLSTPDYPPELGGLSTFASDIYSVLNELNYDVDLLHWKGIGNINATKLGHMDHVLQANIHFMGGYYSPYPKLEQINFIHGSEILFYSPNPLKRMVKKALKKKYLNFFESSKKNVFISEFTFNKLVELGLKPDYSRDLIFHNCIDISSAKYYPQNISDHIRLCCIARDVPHKNLDGAILMAKQIAEVTSKEVTLYITADRESPGPGVTLKNMSGMDNATREEVYQSAHFNLLLSKDHSHCGFFEGFGLTVLEAGKYGTPSIVMNSGGLSESVHHLDTGIVIKDLPDLNQFIPELFQNERYQKMRQRVYDHTVQSHGLDQYKRFLRCILES